MKEPTVLRYRNIDLSDTRAIQNELKQCIFNSQFKETAERTDVEKAHYEEFLVEFLGRYGYVVDNIFEDLLKYFGVRGVVFESEIQQKIRSLLQNGAKLTYLYISGSLIKSDSVGYCIGLGAIANLIFFVYDDVIDNGHINSVLVAQENLAGASNAGSLRYSFVDGSLIKYCVDEYFSILDRVSHSENSDSMRIVLENYIIKIYEAENKSSFEYDENPIAERYIQRKSALTSVVMGLPIWVGVRKGAGDLRITDRFNHFIWLYRIGLLWGVLDDIQDMTSDLVSNRANIILSNSNRMGCDRACEMYVDYLPLLLNSVRALPQIQESERPTDKFFVWMINNEIINVLGGENTLNRFY